MMKIAVFPGSFDPFTLAHDDLVRRGLSLFDKIVIAVGVNSAKKGLLTNEQRLKAIREVYKDEPKIEVAEFQGLTVSFCERIQAQFILRGLRNSKDLEYEDAIAQNNLLLAPHIETYFLLSRSGTAHISSTIVRDIFTNKGKVDHLVNPDVLKVLQEIDEK